METERGRRWWVRALFDLAEQDRRSAAGLLAGGLAYRLFLWLVPAAVVCVAVVGLFADLGGHTPEEAAEAIGITGAVAASVATAAERSTGGNLALFLVGAWATLLAARTAVRALRLVHEVAWDLPRTRAKVGVRAPLVFTGVVIGLIAMHAVSTFLYASGWWGDLLVDLALVAVVAGVALWAMSVLPHPPVSLGALVPGAILAGVVLEALRLITATYLVSKLERVDDLYGALGIALVILFWLYLLGRIMVGAPMLNAALQRRKQAESRAR
jgi:uncharacterized BrkB/YihY/UPF0761 family membrane protein